MRWFGFRPYVPVAKRRADAAKLTAKLQKQGRKITPITIAGRTIATTFWGKAWCGHLESYSDFANRLPRGRTYVRNGSVIDLQIAAGKITALVSGSEVYHITIAIDKLSPQRWKAVKAQCAGQVGSVLELLQGRFAKSVMAILTDRDQGLFPAPAEIRMKCSCPDWAGMCKHLAAVLYGVGARLDHEPELLFVLRQVDHLELLEQAASAGTLAAAGSAGPKTLQDNELADVFGIELEQPSPPAAPASPPVLAGRGSKRAAARRQPPAQTEGAAARSVRAVPDRGKKATPTAKARAGRKPKAPAGKPTAAAKDGTAPAKGRGVRRKTSVDQGAR